MQHSDERPATSGRPSLLSSEQQAEADRHRILSGLDNKPGATTAGAEKARRGKMTWLVAGAAVLAMGAGGMMWLTSEGEKEIVLAGTAPLPPAAAPAAALVAEPAPPLEEAEEVSTAAILEDTPVIVEESAPVTGKKPPVDELTKMLEQQPTPKRVAAKPAPKKAVVVAKAAPPKAAEKPESMPMASNIEPVIKKKTAAVPAKPRARQDSDVELLAALVAHSKAVQPKKTGPAAKLQQCKTLASVSEAEQCRARLCAASAKNESECKAPSLVKASAES